LFDASIRTLASICKAPPKAEYARPSVAVEVRVERCANERMDLDRLALDQYRFKSLYTKTVQ
jgi:hypothetical protein